LVGVPKKAAFEPLFCGFLFDTIINTMQEKDDILHERIKNIMVDIMAVLYENGIKEVQIGAMMRLLGVADDKAAGHDNELIELDENFGAMLVELNKSTTKVPDGATIH